MEQGTQVKEGSIHEVSAPLPLTARIARLRAELDASPHKGKTLMELSPAGMVHVNPTLVDFTDWQQWSQWSRSMEVYQRRKSAQEVCV